MRQTGRCPGSCPKILKSSCSRHSSVPHQTRQPPYARSLILCSNTFSQGLGKTLERRYSKGNQCIEQAGSFPGSNFQTNPFLRASHKKPSLTQSRTAPAFAIHCFHSSNFFVARGIRFGHHHLSVIGERDQLISREQHVPCAKTRLFPFHGSGFGVYTFKGAFSEFLETDHPVKVAVLLNRRAPQAT